MQRIQPDAAEVGTFMVRHSGFLSLTVTAIVAVTAFAFAGHSRSFLSESPSVDLQNSAAMPEFQQARIEASGDVLALTPNDSLLNSFQSVNVERIPENARIIVGSLDLSGEPHLVTVEVIRKDGFRRVSNAPEREVPAPAVVRVKEQLLVRKTSADNLPPGIKAAESVANRISKDRLTQRAGLTDATSTDNSLHPCDAVSPTRQFLVPHFEHSGTIQQVSSASLIACDSRVAVYADDCLLASPSQGLDHVTSVDVRDTVVRILQTVEMGLLEFVQHCVGPITDLDSDRHISIVITDLDRQNNDRQIPVRGCVRDRDFLEYGQADFTGDIVYLHYSLPHGLELAAMLAHELTHAAVFSRIRERYQTTAAAADQTVGVPSWLNEAISHWVELKVTASPEAFSQRVAMFRSNPASHPIVASDCFLSAENRRGGSRAAGVMFLRQFVTQTDQLPILLNTDATLEQRVANISGRRFSNVFRDWTTSQAVYAIPQSLNRSGSVESSRTSVSEILQKRLYGTAFFVLDCGAGIDRLRISSDTASQLQITIVEPHSATE